MYTFEIEGNEMVVYRKGVRVYKAGYHKEMSVRATFLDVVDRLQRQLIA